MLFVFSGLPETEFYQSGVSLQAARTCDNRSLIILHESMRGWWVVFFLYNCYERPYAVSY